ITGRTGTEGRFLAKARRAQREPRRLYSHQRKSRIVDEGLLPLNRPARQAEVRGGREHVAVVSPHVAFSGLLSGRQVHRVGGSYEEIGRSGNDQGTGSPQQSLVNGNELPQALLYMLVEAGGKFVRVTGRQRAFAQAAMDYRVELGQSP